LKETWLRCSKQQSVFRCDGGGNYLCPDAIALLLETQGPHDVNGHGAVNPAGEVARIADCEIVTARKDGDACARRNGAIENPIGQATAGMARDDEIAAKDLDVL
jgi:hypothetical protein